MSFGFSPSDVVLATQLAYKTVQNSRKACGEHDELSREIHSLQVVLCRLEQEVDNPESPINRAGKNCKEEIEPILNGSGKVLRTLNGIFERYNALSEEERSTKKLWQKIRFGNGKMADLGDLRSKVTFYTSALSLLLNIVSMSTMGRVEQKIDEAGGELKDIQQAVHWLTARMMSKSRCEGSVLTAYTNDDRSIWKEFRRELVRDGFSSAILRKHKATIKAYVSELGDRGLLDDHIDENVEEDVKVGKEQEEREDKELEEGLGKEKNREKRQTNSSVGITQPTSNSDSTDRLAKLSDDTGRKKDEVRHAYVESVLDVDLNLDGSENDPVFGPVAAETFELRDPRPLSTESGSGNAQTAVADDGIEGHDMSSKPGSFRHPNVGGNVLGSREKEVLAELPVVSPDASIGQPAVDNTSMTSQPYYGSPRGLSDAQIIYIADTNGSITFSDETRDELTKDLKTLRRKIQVDYSVKCREFTSRFCCYPSSKREIHGGLTDLLQWVMGELHFAHIEVNEDLRNQRRSLIAEAQSLQSTIDKEMAEYDEMHGVWHAFHGSIAEESISWALDDPTRDSMSSDEAFAELQGRLGSLIVNMPYSHSIFMPYYAEYIELRLDIRTMYQGLEVFKDRGSEWSWSDHRSELLFSPEGMETLRVILTTDKSTRTLRSRNGSPCPFCHPKHSAVVELDPHKDLAWPEESWLPRKTDGSPNTRDTPKRDARNRERDKDRKRDYETKKWNKLSYIEDVDSDSDLDTTKNNERKKQRDKDRKKDRETKKRDKVTYVEDYDSTSDLGTDRRHRWKEDIDRKGGVEAKKAPMQKKPISKPKAWFSPRGGYTYVEQLAK